MGPGESTDYVSIIGDVIVELLAISNDQNGTVGMSDTVLTD